MYEPMLDPDWQELDRRIQAIVWQQQLKRDIRRRLAWRAKKRRLAKGILIAFWCAGTFASFLWLAR